MSAVSVAALQTVGAYMVIAMVITPGATAYLLSDRFSHLLTIACTFGALSSATGAYCSYFLDIHPGGLIISLQTILFLVVFVFAPKYGLLKQRQAISNE